MPFSLSIFLQLLLYSFFTVTTFFYSYYFNVIYIKVELKPLMVFIFSNKPNLCALYFLNKVHIFQINIRSSIHDQKQPHKSSLLDIFSTPFLQYTIFVFKWLLENILIKYMYIDNCNKQRKKYRNMNYPNNQHCLWFRKGKHIRESLSISFYQKY